MKRTFIQISIMVMAVSANAQDAFTNNGNLQVHTGANLSAYGAFTNNSAAALTNNGSFYLRGNLSNDQASMAVGTGTLEMIGTSAQAVNGAQTFKTFNLNTNNAAGITINNNLSVTGAHTYTAGMITTALTPNYMVYEAGASYTGTTDARHVNGWVKKIGSTNFVFPVGNATLLRSVALTTLSVASEFNARYLASTPSTTSLVSPVTAVNDLEYWAINRTSGGTARVNMNWDNPRVHFRNWVVPDILVAGFNGTAWGGHGGSASGTTTTTGTITSNVVSSFNLFVFGTQSIILPVKLLGFNATRPADHTIIDWSVASEFNMQKYVVERSDNGVDFYSIGELSPRNSNHLEDYQTKDYAAINGVAYYRLRYTEKGGQINYSKIVTIRANGGSGLTLVANPVHGKILLLAEPALKGIFNYTLLTMSGQLSQSGKIQIQSGGTYQVNLHDKVIPGAYTLEIGNGVQRFNFKLIVR